MQTIGLVGAGHIGSQLARLAVRDGYNVVISNSRGPQSLAGLVAELGPKARAATPAEAAEAGDIVVVSVPLKSYRAVPVAPLAGKVVIDTNNYYPERDGTSPRSTANPQPLPSSSRRTFRHRRCEGLQPYLRRGADHRWPAARYA
jgi:8-hydroxy-5-deazaflavin:NADPH oxidoreductase